MNQIDLECPSCGATMTHDGKGTATCSYCGHTSVFEMPETAEHRANVMERVAYARERARLDDQRAHAPKSSGKGKVIAGIVVAAIVILMPAIIALSKASTSIDPFDYADVTFSGTNGNGVVTVSLNGKPLPDEISSGMLYFDAEPFRRLSEGDVVTVTARLIGADDAHLSPTKRGFTVTGLDKQLTDLYALDDKQLETIHNKAKSIVKKLGKSPGTNAELADLKQVKLYLLSDGEKQNKLFDVFEATYDLDGTGTHTAYLVAYFKNIVVRGGETPTFDCDESMYVGDIIKIGEGFKWGYTTGYDSLEDLEADLPTRVKTAMTLTSRDG